MDAARREQLGMLASSVAQNIAFQLPSVEEAIFVGTRVFAMLLANGVDLLDMQDKGLSIDQALEDGMVRLRQEARRIVEVRLLHEHAPTGGPN